MNNKALFLILKRKWFDLIKSGEKTHEYRDVKPYWIKRIEGKNWSRVIFANGYKKDRELMMFSIDNISITTHPNHLGDIGEYYDIKLGKRIL